MKRNFSLFLLVALLLCWFSFPVLATDVEGSAATETVAEPDTSTSDQATLEDINNSLGVIQSQLWIILVVGLLGYVYKFFHMFF